MKVWQGLPVREVRRGHRGTDGEYPHEAGRRDERNRSRRARNGMKGRNILLTGEI